MAAKAAGEHAAQLSSVLLLLVNCAPSTALGDTARTDHRQRHGTYEPIETCDSAPLGQPTSFEMMPHALGSLNTQNCWGLP